jgi:hypothetical protein
MSELAAAVPFAALAIAIGGRDTSSSRVQRNWDKLV